MTQQKTSIRHQTLLKSGLLVAAVAMTTALATGCDSGPGGSSHSSSAMNTEARIEGMIQDRHGPISEGNLEVRDKKGAVILSMPIAGSNHYSITVPAGTAYPILMIATPKEGTNLEVVKAVVTSSLADRMDITDITTLVVNAAQELGGLTEENIAKASGGAIGLRQRQGVSAGAGGGGMGPGQSGGGASRGGHAGHDMSNMGGSGGTPAPNQPSSGTMQNMQH